MSSFFDPFLESCLAGGAGHGGTRVNLEGASGSVITGVFLDSTYAEDTTDQWYSDLTAAAIVQAAGGGDYTFALSGLAVTQLAPGVKFDAQDHTAAEAGQLTGVGDGNDDLDMLVLFDDQGASGGADPVICRIDTGTGFGGTPNNSTIEIEWNASGIFTII